MGSVHSHTHRGCLGRDPREDGGFDALMCKKCAQSRRFGLGSGSVGDTIGAGGGAGVGEPRTGIINPPWGCRVQGCRV